MGVALAALALAHAPEAGAVTEAKNVLILFSNARLLPANVEAEAAIRATLAKSKGRPAEVFAEFLDSPRFGGERYATTMATYLHEKYAFRPPNAIVAAGDNALAFLLRYRREIFPAAPIIHMGVSRAELRGIGPMPSDVVGVPADFDFSGTIDLALKACPKVRRLFVVTGASATDRAFEARARADFARFAGRLSTEFLSALPTGELLERVGTLGPDAIVFTTGYFEDGDKKMFTPRDTAAGLARAAAAPVYVPWNTFLGTGVVGGRMPTFEGIGRQAAEIVADLLEGTAPAALPVPSAVPMEIHLDWRQARRWGIGERDVPPGTVWHFREPTLWQSHRNWLIAAAGALAFQAALIAGLLFQRRRRREAILAADQDRLRLVRASRLALAGELTGSIAHEINQPLGAILSNAAAAELILASGGDRREEVLQILADIRRDDQRASDVIRRLRVLLAKNEVERKPFELNEVLSDIEPVLQAEARRRKMTLVFRPAASPVTLIGDRIQLQQVLINLVLNAMDAAADVPEDRHTVVLSAEKTADGIAVTVRDRGHGIAPADLPRIFDSFFSTKSHGVGLGLSITRTLVETHGGRVWAENGPGEGATFHVELPAAGGVDVPT
jgi:signal transduction histidine kinase